MDTNYALNHPLAVKKWSKELMREALKKTHALQFMGKGKDVLCTIKTDLSEKDGTGDRIRVGIRSQMTGEGVDGDNTLEGNEEPLETFNQDVYIDQLRHAGRSGGKMSEQRVPFSVRDEIRDALGDWWSDRIDTWFFTQLTGNTAQSNRKYGGFNSIVAPDADHITYGTSGSTTEGAMSDTYSVVSNLVVTSRFNLNAIDAAVEKAKLAKNALRPFNIGGKKKLAMFIHPYQVTDLRKYTAAGQWADIQKAAIQGGAGSENPIYSGALGEYNNVILHESTRIPAAPTNASVRRAVLCGAQAACIAFGQGYGKEVFTWVEELFDYKNKLGVAAGCQAGLVKTRYNNSDFGTVVVPTYAVASA
jgi:N4-gp56 family major capsid protein